MASSRGYLGNIRAPEFPPDLEWLNTERRLSLAELRGKLVLLDFWTYGCINCIHIIPDLKRLEALYPDELVVIGVHSAKFSNERDVESIRQIILRHELAHPVVNDREFQIWQSYAVRSWPTTVLIDPRGKVLAAHSGEGVFEAYRDLISQAVTRYDAEEALDRRPLQFYLENAQRSDTPLSFPGKVLADEEGGRLFVADTNHHRIVVLNLGGHVPHIIGSGTAGLANGGFRESQFSKPQGMALSSDRLYIADTDNHAIRVADLDKRSVVTLAGDGTLGRSSGRMVLGEAQLNSPWDLVFLAGKLYIDGRASPVVGARRGERPCSPVRGKRPRGLARRVSGQCRPCPAERISR